MVERHGISLPVVTVYTHLGLGLCALERRRSAGGRGASPQLEKWWGPSVAWMSLRAPAYTLDRLPARSLGCRAGMSRGDRVNARLRWFWAAFETCIQCALVCAELDRPADFETALAPVRPMFAGTGYEHFTYQPDLAEEYYALLKGDSSEVSRDVAVRPGARPLRSWEADPCGCTRPCCRVVCRSAGRANRTRIRPGVDSCPAPTAPFTRREGLALAAAHLHARSVRSAARRPAARVFTQSAAENDRVAQSDHRVRRSERARATVGRCVLVGRGGRRRGPLVERGAASAAQADRRSRCNHSAGRPVSLDKARVWVDVWAFEDLLAGPARQSKC